MKKIYFFLFILFVVTNSFSQSVICDPNGKLMIFTNYDGGYLTIDVDVDIPGLKIGVVSYEGVAIAITGMYANNVTAVAYAGFNSSNPHCGTSIATSISGTSGGCVNTITFAPSATLSNSNGNNSIICGSNCSITTYQGGCNTIDQIEDYFLNLFSGYTLYAHKVQYGCWNGTLTVSGGGTCCGLITGTTAFENEQEISISPNPAATSLYVNTGSSGTVQLRIIDVLGEELMSKKIQGKEVTLDVSGLGNGIYLIEMRGERNTFTKKIIIDR